MREVVARLYAEQASWRADTPLAEQREGYEAFARDYPPEPDVAVEPVVAGGVRAAWLTAPDARADRAVLYFHGGGYVTGSVTTHQAITSRLSGSAGARVLALDYRLAPEHPFPAAVEDAVSAYRWLLAEGFAPSRIALAGDSAGGGLTVAGLIALRDRAIALPAAGVPISPWLDLTGETGWRDADPATDPMVLAAALDLMTADYIGGGNPRDPLAAPIHADLSGLPPLLVQVGRLEILLSDATLLAEQARAAGVDVTLEIEEGAPHVWHHFAPKVPEALAAIERIGAFLRRHI